MHRLEAAGLDTRDINLVSRRGRNDSATLFIRQPNMLTTNDHEVCVCGRQVLQPHPTRFYPCSDLGGAKPPIDIVHDSQHMDSHHKEYFLRVLYHHLVQQKLMTLVEFDQSQGVGTCKLPRAEPHSSKDWYKSQRS
jgi:hypothetical protein